MHLRSSRITGPLPTQPYRTKTQAESRRASSPVFPFSELTQLRWSEFVNDGSKKSNFKPFKIPTIDSIRHAFFQQGYGTTVTDTWIGGRVVTLCSLFEGACRFLSQKGPKAYVSTESDWLEIAIIMGHYAYDAATNQFLALPDQKELKGLQVLYDANVAQIVKAWKASEDWFTPPNTENGVDGYTGYPVTLELIDISPQMCKSHPESPNATALRNSLISHFLSKDLTYTATLEDQFTSLELVHELLCRIGSSGLKTQDDNFSMWMYHLAEWISDQLWLDPNSLDKEGNLSFLSWVYRAIDPSHQHVRIWVLGLLRRALVYSRDTCRPIASRRRFIQARVRLSHHWPNEFLASMPALAPVEILDREYYCDGGEAKIYAPKGDKHKGKVLRVSKQGVDISSNPSQSLDRITELIINSSVCHPNVLAFRGFFEDKSEKGPRMVIASDLVENSHPIHKWPSSDAKAFSVVMCDIAKGLAHLHEHGIVHGDVHTSNVLVNTSDPRRPRSVLIDFGFSIIEGIATQTKRITAKHAYLSNELWPNSHSPHLGSCPTPSSSSLPRSSSSSSSSSNWEPDRLQPLTRQTDAFACGGLFYCILHPGQSPKALACRCRSMSQWEKDGMLENTWSPTVNLSPVCLEGLKDIIGGLWHRDPSERLPVIGLADELQRVFNGGSRPLKKNPFAEYSRPKNVLESRGGGESLMSIDTPPVPGGLQAAFPSLSPHTQRYR